MLSGCLSNLGLHDTGIGGEVLRNPGELMAGEGAQVSLRLLHDYVIQPGETVPVDQITVSRLAFWPNALRPRKPS